MTPERLAEIKAKCHKHKPTADCSALVGDMTVGEVLALVAAAERTKDLERLLEDSENWIKRHER